MEELPNLRIQRCCLNCLYKARDSNDCLFFKKNEMGDSIKIKPELVCDAHIWRDPIRYVNNMSMKFKTKLPEDLQP